MEFPQHITDLCSRTVGEVVAEDYRRADVFKAFGIDFCCGGDKTVQQAGEEKGVACDELMRALTGAEEKASPSLPGHVDVRAWPPDFLANYIVNVHHRYVRDNAPRLRELTRTVARVHGHTNPETVEMARLAGMLVDELLEHAEKEEQGLFPYVAALVAQDRGETIDSEAEIASLEHEHDGAGALLREIRSLSNDYTLPEDACNTFRMAYRLLEEFEADLHRHVHLENNILFPAARRLEASLARPA